MTRTQLWCDHCEELVDHDRGYLVEHYKSKMRGALNTGSKVMCDGSNTKPQQDLKTVKFTGTCPSCLGMNVVEYSEKYPGSLPRYGGILEQQCPECSPEGHYCTNCDRLLHEKTVKAGDGTATITADTRAELKAQLISTGMDAASVDQIIDTYLRPAAPDGTTPTVALDVTVWVDKGGDEECPDGEDHTPVHRDRKDAPVQLTDSHVIPVVD